MGYDASRIVGISTSELNEFTCSICLGIFNEPVFTKCCQQTYCKGCITGWLASSDTCPNDRMFLENNDLSSVPRLVNNLLMNLLIKCEYEENGCKSIVTICELKNHIDTCPFVNCATCGLKKSNVGIHDCITELINKNRSMADDIKRLSDQMNAAAAAQHAFEEAKTAPGNYVIESYSEFTRDQCQLLVELCRTAIFESNTFEDLTANLSIMLYDVSVFFDEKWTAIALAENGEVSYYVECGKSFRIKFGRLKIALFSAT